MASKKYEQVIREIIKERPKYLNRANDVMRLIKDRLCHVNNNGYKKSYRRHNIPTSPQVQQILNRISHEQFVKGGTSMMAQANLDKFGTFSEPMLNSPGNCEFHIENGIWIGTCQHYKKHKNPPKQPCRHVQAHLLHELRQTQKWLEFKSSWKSKAEFDCFETAIEAITIYKGEELSFISRIILTIAYSRGSVHGDDVYNLWGEPSKPQVMSAAWSGLIKKGLIVRVGTHQSDRDRNRSDQGVYRLTPQAEDLMLNARGAM